MQIVQYPHPALRWKSSPITEITPDLHQIVREMFDLMYQAEGIGLAANQVGLPYRIFVINLSGEKEHADEEHVFINPEIVHRKGSQEGEEGCLSLPKLFAPVRRAKDIVVEAFDLTGEGFEMDLDDLASRAVQHETDHLDGILFIDRLADPKKREVSPVLEDFELEYRRQQALGTIPPDSAIAAHLKQLAQAQHV